MSEIIFVSMTGSDVRHPNSFTEHGTARCSGSGLKAYGPEHKHVLNPRARRGTRPLRAELQKNSMVHPVEGTCVRNRWSHQDARRARVGWQQATTGIELALAQGSQPE